MSRYRRNSRSIKEVASDPNTPSHVLIGIMKSASISALNWEPSFHGASAFAVAELCLVNPSLNVVDFCKYYDSNARDYYAVPFRLILENFSTDLAILDGSIGEVAGKFCYYCAVSIASEDAHARPDTARAPDISNIVGKERMFLRACYNMRFSDDSGCKIPGNVPVSSYRKLAHIAAMYLPDATRFGVENNLFPSVMLEYMPNGRGGYRRGKARRLSR